MSELTITIVRLGLLALLWVFIFSVIGVLRGDLFGTRVTARAAKRIHEIAAKEHAVAALRIAVNGGGCSGFQYDFVFSDKSEDDDRVFERDGARVLVDATSLGFMAGSELDFIDDLMGQSFRIQNPLAKSSCGCGTSFSL